MTALARPSSLSDIHADVWQAHALATVPVRVQPTGNAALDAQLPGGGEILWSFGQRSRLAG